MTCHPTWMHYIPSQPVCDLISQCCAANTNLEYSSHFCCQMVWRFKILISNIFHIPGHAKFALWWQTSWLSDRHNKNSNCLQDCPMIIYVQFGVNQIYSFWENWLFQFPIGSYNETFSDSHFGFPIDKPKIKTTKNHSNQQKQTKRTM